MEIILVQPTDDSPNWLTHDYWDTVSEDDQYENHMFYAELDHYHCKYEPFSSFAEAEGYLDAMDVTDMYKRRMHKELDKLKRDVKIFNWAVA